MKNYPLGQTLNGVKHHTEKVDAKLSESREPTRGELLALRDVLKAASLKVNDYLNSKGG